MKPNDLCNSRQDVNEKMGLSPTARGGIANAEVARWPNEAMFRGSNDPMAR